MSVNDFLERLDALPAVSDDELKKRREDDRERAFVAHQDECVRKLKRDIGDRYKGENLDSFEVTGPEQKAVVEKLRNIQSRISEFIKKRHQLFLYGSVGCGKDHLIISLLQQAALNGHRVSWKQGTDLYDQLAFARDNNDTQLKIYTRLTEPEVLVLSDPVFARNWTAAKSDALAKIVRRRYDRGRLTWITTNLSSLEQAPKLFFPDVYDRLKENALFVRCNWPSYRRSHEQPS